MLERYVGRDVFREGLRRYFRDNAWKNADTSDFVSAMERASGKELAPFAESFFDHPGVPVIDVESNCSGDRLVSLTVRQQPSLIGARDQPARPSTWSIPFCAAARGTNRRSVGS